MCFEVMKMSEEKKMGRVKRCCVCFGSSDVWKRGVADVFAGV